MVETNEIIKRVEQAAKAIREGKMVVMMDNPDRENEGDLVCAAEFCTPDTVNFMKTHGRGLICVPMAPACFRRAVRREPTVFNGEISGLTAMKED